MPTMFFMPWTHVKAASNIGPLSFVPYKRCVAPNSLGKITQQSIDAIIGNYADRAFIQHADSTVPVNEALILRWPGDEERDSLLTDDEIQDRLQQAQLLTFAALAERQFGRHWNYCNTDSLTTIAQNFSEDHPAASSITTRRRDGNTSYHMAGRGGKPIFLRPLHVADQNLLEIDENFARVLLSVPAGPLRDRLLDSIALFNNSNTDASEVPLSAEIVLMRAALETLVGATHQTADLKERLVELMAPYLGPIVGHNVHLQPRRWKDRWNEVRPFSAWVQDFCHWRNESAHGKSATKRHRDPIWSLCNHLLFTSWLMSRIVKVVLAQEGLYTLTDEDKDELANIEQFFTYDISARDDGGPIYWLTVQSQVQSLQLERILNASTQITATTGEDFGED